mgnify:CR=1 FL=1
MSTFHLPPAHCSVVLMSDYVIVACLSSRTVLVSLHVPMYSPCRHTHTQSAQVFLEGRLLQVDTFTAKRYSL